MGINLAIVLNHYLAPEDLVALPERVRQSAPMQNAAERLWDVMRPRWSNLGSLSEFAALVTAERLSVSEVAATWHRADLARCTWAGFSLHFGRQAVEGVHLEKLAGFVLDRERLRVPLQQCAHALARELRSSAIAYGPDCFSPFQRARRADEGVALAEILATAQLECGGPAASIREMADDDEELKLDRQCYFVEEINREDIAE